MSPDQPTAVDSDPAARCPRQSPSTTTQVWMNAGSARFTLGTALSPHNSWTRRDDTRSGTTLQRSFRAMAKGCSRLRPSGESSRTPGGGSREATFQHARCRYCPSRRRTWTVRERGRVFGGERAHRGQSRTRVSRPRHPSRSHPLLHHWRGPAVESSASAALPVGSRGSATSGRRRQHDLPGRRKRWGDGERPHHS